MARKHKIPIKEASGEKNLSGSYLISFKLDKISDQDQIIISDIIEGLARAFEHSNGLPKISHLDIEKTDSNGTPLSQKPLKAGDYVKLNSGVEITAQLSEENGTYVVGSKLTSNIIGDVKFTIPEDIQAVVNQVKDHDAELIEFDSTVNVKLRDAETDVEEDVSVNIDAIKINKEYLDKIGE